LSVLVKCGVIDLGRLVVTRGGGSGTDGGKEIDKELGIGRIFN